MPRNLSKFAIPALLAATVAVACSGPTVDAPRPRHVLLVSIDTLRADALGCYGDERARTETLDRLAAEGVRFDAAISPVPLTLPSHAALLTGTHPWRLGIRHNGIYRLAPRFETLAETLDRAGFETAAVVGGYPLSDFSGLDQGFAIYDDSIPQEGGALYTHPERDAREVTDAAIAWLDSRPDPTQPFFLFVHYYDPHAPHEPPPRYRVDPSSVAGPESMRVAYGTEIAYVDDQIERLLAAVAESGVLDDTLVVVTSDHGEGLLEHGEPTHGLFLYEGVARVPMILRFPAGLPAGGRVASVVGLIDLMPTILESLGLAVDPAIDGRSRWELAGGARDDVDAGEAYLESRYPWLEYGWAPLRAVRTPEWKYVDAPEAELYALRDDPGERTNVIAGHREIADRLHADLDDAFRDATDGDPEEIPEEELERLRSLGYLQGVDTTGEDDSVGADPKSKIEQYIELRLTAGEMMEGRYAEAETRLEALVERDPGNVAVYCRLADARMGLRDWNGAESALQQALGVARGRGRAAVVWRLAAVERGRGNHERALEYYREHAKIAPLSARTVQRMAETLRDARRDPEAEAVLRDWLDDHPSSLVALKALARLLDDGGRHEEADVLWRRVLGIRPDDDEALSTLKP